MERPDRKEPTCAPNDLKPVFEALPPVRPIPKCDPPVDPVAPDFVPPTTVTPAPAPKVLPSPYTFSSESVTVNCSDLPGLESGVTPPTGDSKTVLAGLYEQDLYLQNLGLPIESLYYIADITKDQTASLALINASDTAGLASLFNISLQWAQTIIDAANQLKLELLDRATAAAIALLSCRWANQEQTVTCASGAVGGANNPSVVAAGTFFSNISQADADALALAEAERLLECVWTNDEIERCCSDIGLPGLDGEPESPYPGDETRTRLTCYTVAAGTYSSPTSKQDANDIAIAYALAALDCFYLNEEVIKECDLDVDDVAAVVAPYTYVPGEWGSGNPVTVPAGTVASEVSLVDANERAESIALSLLRCRWDNRELTYSCDDKASDITDPAQIALHVTPTYPGIYNWENKDGQVIYFTSLGANLEMMASPPKSSVYSASVAASTVFSDTSRQDAEEQAAALAISQLDCSYCNPRINPVCYPQVIPVDLDTLPLPVALTEIIDEQGHVKSPFSVDSTTGVPGIIYAPESGEVNWQPVDLMDDVPVFICAATAAEAATLADFTSLIPARDLTPASRDSNCQYGNDRICGSCQPADATSGCCGSVTEDNKVHPDNAWLLYYSPRSTPRCVTVEADTIFADSKENANTLARLAALSQLDCFFESPPMNLACGVVLGVEPLPDVSLWDYGATVPDPILIPQTNPGYLVTDQTHPVADESVGSLINLVPIPLGYGRSYVSPREAFDMAINSGLGRLDCFVKAVERVCCEPKPDTRPRMEDGRPNASPWITEGIAEGGTGQVARFKYSGDAVWAYGPGGSSGGGSSGSDGGAYRVPNYGTEPACVYGEGTSTVNYEEASDRAQADGFIKLDCTHTNWGRENFKCPHPSDILHVAYTCSTDAFEASTTEDANREAERYAIARTICGECSPFKLLTFEPTLPDVEPGMGFATRLCPGVGTFWGLSTSNSGVGAKLAACKEGAIDGVGTKHMFFMDCGYELPMYLPTDTAGNYIFWIKVKCCDDGNTNAPALILYYESASYSAAEIEAPEFYPTAETTSLNQDPDAFYTYIGATVVGLADRPDGATILTRQTVDENLTWTSGGGDAGPCAFGKIKTWDAGAPAVAHYAIVGGSVVCGAPTWYFDDLEIDPLTDGVWLVSLDCNVVVNQDDDYELLLPGIYDGTKPVAWTLATYTPGDDYAEGTPPTVGSGAGVIILPIGKLTVAGGVVTLDATGCGGFIINHCGGTLSYIRG